jgi:hypothetical protein
MERDEFVLESRARPAWLLLRRRPRGDVAAGDDIVELSDPHGFA